MSTFPTLKTGAVIQYPAARVTQFSTGIVQFLDGEEQRYRDFAQPYHRWVVKLDGLDETELQAIRTFAQEMNGAVGVFSFTDPWDATVYPACSLEGAAWPDTVTGPLQSATTLTIRELRG
jgi:hypothetical protein